ncbi:uncharacterized protein CcaverHIS019_0107210 [Cutaneotrichosporon cavernicola]|uniref:Sec39 domain-containing protein n=1 Tax=Cutaneotrichosporon cavernicola TaxID=279322 RepID=A0AA48IDV4_9TREE|nr:uncharacterized protein CcaverHIS019_0107210 [Cutaneotrichosporon cavernicola]BEI88003.1 hypothetical protein CcaverHIS019_0107210 [Cutaneotrichosporon cavernicola]BEI95778.1 hypothetical protein CcaverHIS631_0107270 [Cutaneotrichosporon cavernicola]BEJ03551.1 hypothetical protein CcaverHIS641_0107260 [Cutaneotrichosporon cavernicola]
MDDSGPVASSSTYHLLDPVQLLSGPVRALTTEVVLASLDALPSVVRLITAANLILSGRLYDQVLLRCVIDSGLAAGEEETVLFEGDVRARLEGIPKSSGGWEGWGMEDVYEAAAAAVDSARRDAVRALAILTQARRRLDTYDTSYPPRAASKTISTATKTPKVEDIELDDPWGDSDEEDVPPMLDDPWADKDESYPPTPPPPVAPLPETEPPIDPSTFILQPITLSALNLATLADVRPLRIVCQRHGSDLYPYRLAIVEAIPGWVSPAEDDVQTLLPGVWEDSEHERWPTGRLDPETSLLDALATKYGLYALNPPPATLLPPAHPEPLSSDSLSAWYASRVGRLDTLGLLDAQLAWVQHGAALGVPGLDIIGEDLSLLSRLIYDGNLTPTELAHWNLSTWRAAEPEAIVRAYLHNSTPTTVVGDIRRLVLPYLYVLESRAERAGEADKGLVERMLNGAILDLSLHLALSCFEASKATLAAAQRLIKDDQTVARLALAVLYGSGESAWPTMSAIFECLPVWDVSGDDPDSDREAMETTLESLAAFIRPTVQGETHDARTLFWFFKPLPFSSLSRALDILDVHLESGEILARYDVRVLMRTLLQSARERTEQVTLAEKVVRRGQGMDERHWIGMWEDMGRLRGGEDTLLRGAFGMLSSEELMRIFLHGLLSAGNFVVAKKVIRRLEPEGFFSPADLEDVVLMTSKEFYMRAETGNIHTGDMKLAYECLSIAPSSPAIRAEQNFVQATSRVASFKALSTLTPAEIRYTPNKLDLVRRVLRTDDAYRHAGIVMELTEKLGYTEPAPRAEVLSMLVDAAVAQNDWEIAREHVDALVGMAQPDLGDDPSPASANTTETPSNPPDEGEGDGWGWDQHESTAATPAPPPTKTADKAKSDAAVRDVTYRACLALGSSAYPDLGARLALIAQAIALAPADAVGTMLPLYHGLEAKIAADPSLLKPSSRPTSPALPSLPAFGTPTETMLGSRRAAQAARMAYGLGASLNLPSLRGMSVSPALGSAKSTKSIVSPIERSVSRNSRGSMDRPRSSFESGRSQDRDASALFDSVQDEPSVRAGARRALVKGVGWLLGAEEGEQIL